MTANKILINRAPVLTLWAAVVAERLGFKHDEVLSLGKAVAGFTAQSEAQLLPSMADKQRETTSGQMFADHSIGGESQRGDRSGGSDGDGSTTETVRIDKGVALNNT